MGGMGSIKHTAALPVILSVKAGNLAGRKLGNGFINSFAYGRIGNCENHVIACKCADPCVGSETAATISFALCSYRFGSGFYVNAVLEFNNYDGVCKP